MKICLYDNINEFYILSQYHFHIITTNLLNMSNYFNLEIRMIRKRNDLCLGSEYFVRVRTQRK